MLIHDKLGATSALTLPVSGLVFVGAELSSAVDTSILRQELTRFYGDRFEVVEVDDSQIADPEPTPKPRTRKPR
jgi:hypothetical protein